MRGDVVKNVLRLRSESKGYSLSRPSNEVKEGQPTRARRSAIKARQKLEFSLDSTTYSTWANPPP